VTLAVLGKSILIALVAAIAAWAFPMLYFAIEEGSIDLGPTSLMRQASFIALMGSYCVGLPIALVTYFLARQHLMRSPNTLFTIAFLASVMMVLVCLVFGDAFVALVFGVPAAIAAWVFAVLGWLWILKPQHEVLDALP